MNADELTIAQIKAELDWLGAKYASKARKADLIALLNEAIEADPKQRAEKEPFDLLDNECDLDTELAQGYGDEQNYLKGRAVSAPEKQYAVLAWNEKYDGAVRKTTSLYKEKHKRDVRPDEQRQRGTSKHKRKQDARQAKINRGVKAIGGGR